MFINSRAAPEELLYLKALSARAELNEIESRKFDAIARGYEGECLYDDIFDEVGHNDVYILRDLYLKIGESVTQYDVLIVDDQSIKVNEIKNYTGDYKYEGGRWFKGTFELHDDAFDQLSRAVGKLKKLNYDVRGDFAVTGKLVFPNDDFYLKTDDSSIWSKIVVRSGLKRYFRTFSGAKISREAKFIVKSITSRIVENPYFKTDAAAERLKRGLYCGSCGNFNLVKSRFHLTCASCGSKETTETHLLRAMSDYKYLNHGRAMTRNDLMKFIGNQIHWKTVLRALVKHCHINKNGVSTSYTFKYYNFQDAMKNSNCHIKYKDRLVTK